MQQRLGKFAWVMAWFGLVAGQLHALSRFATADGKADLQLPLTRAWAEPAAPRASTIADAGGSRSGLPDLRQDLAPWCSRRSPCARSWCTSSGGRPAGFEKWAWRLALTAYV
jgi:hypothetical protein